MEILTISINYNPFSKNYDERELASILSKGDIRQ